LFEKEQKSKGDILYEGEVKVEDMKEFLKKHSSAY
jgi:hypothetical protein